MSDRVATLWGLHFVGTATHGKFFRIGLEKSGNVTAGCKQVGVKKRSPMAHIASLTADGRMATGWLAAARRVLLPDEARRQNRWDLHAVAVRVPIVRRLKERGNTIARNTIARNHTSPRPTARSAGRLSTTASFEEILPDEI